MSTKRRRRRRWSRCQGQPHAGLDVLELLHVAEAEGSKPSRGSRPDGPAPRDVFKGSSPPPPRVPGDVYPGSQPASPMRSLTERPRSEAIFSHDGVAAPGDGARVEGVLAARTRKKPAACSKALAPAEALSSRRPGRRRLPGRCGTPRCSCQEGPSPRVGQELLAGRVSSTPHLVEQLMTVSSRLFLGRSGRRRAGTGQRRWTWDRS